jgi:hypothetical protein
MLQQMKVPLSICSFVLDQLLILMYRLTRLWLDKQQQQKGK